MLKKANGFGENNSKYLKPVFGIDLGTTNSAISVITSGTVPEVIKLENDKFTMPSCVLWEDGEFIVGRDAYERRYQSNCIYSVKRFMQDPDAKIELVDRDKTLTMTPAEVSAEILKGLVRETKGLYGKIEDVVITVPAYFDQNGINATRKAAELAGLNLITIANEPTAAALNFNLDASKERIKDILVYDFGGGTFDVSLIKISESNDMDDIYGFDSNSSSDKIISVEKIGGDTHLGGDDIDNELYRIVCNKLAENGFSTNFDEASRKLITLRLEQFKKKNAKDSVDFNVVGTLKNGSGINTMVRISPSDFKNAILPSYNKTKVIIQQLLNSNDNVSDIVLVGGTTKHAWLPELLKKDFPNIVINDALNPDLVVSQGAAIQGHNTKFNGQSLQIFDILPITIGIKDDDSVFPLITKDTQLPVEKTRYFTTVVDNQRDVQVELLQGNSRLPEECVSLGTLDITGIKPQEAGKPSLAVTVTISSDRLLRCIATIDGIKKEITLNLTGDSSVKKLSGDERLLKRWQRKLEDFKKSGKIKQANTLQNLIDGYGKNVSKKEIMDFLSKTMELEE